MSSRPRAAIKRLADLLLGKPVEDYILERRRAGKSFRVISRDLYLETNGEVDVSDVSLRLWVNDRDVAGVA